MSFTEAQSVYDKAGLGHDAGLGRRPAVLVVDFSCAFTDPSHPLGGEMTAQIEATNELLAVARAQGLPVLFSTIAYSEQEAADELWVRKLPALATLRADSPGVDIDARLGRRPEEAVIVKRGASSFFGTDLAERLAARGVDTLIVCGATTSGCIRATVVDALQHQFRSVVPRECVADRHAAPHDANLFDIQSKYGSVASKDEVLAYLRELQAAV